MIKGILFDFNGVIIDDEPIQMKAYQAVLKEHDIELTDDEYHASHGMDDRTFVAAAFERAGKGAPNGKAGEIIDAKFESWKTTVTAKMPIFDEIPAFVEKMSREFALGIVSMATSREVEYVLDQTGMRRFFSTVVTADHVTNCKPDPQCFRIGFRQLDAARTASGRKPMVHADCLVIEDTAAGIKAARAAQLKTLGVTNTVSAQVLREAGAQAIAKDLSDWMPESIRRVFV